MDKLNQEKMVNTALAFVARIFLDSKTGWRNARTVPPPHPNLWFPENLTENLLHLDNGYSIKKNGNTMDKLKQEKR